MDEILSYVFKELEMIYKCKESNFADKKNLLLKIRAAAVSVQENVLRKKQSSSSEYSEELRTICEYTRQLIADIDTVINNGIVEDEFVGICDCYLYGYEQVVEDLKM